MKFYIGSVLGGPELSGSPVDTIITRIARASHRYQAAHEIVSEGGLDIVYHVPGRLMRPEFEGLRTGKFSKKEKLLMVQVSVPSLFEGEQHVQKFLIEALRQAIELAMPIFKSTRIPFSQDEYLQIVDSIEQDVADGHQHEKT